MGGASAAVIPRCDSRFSSLASSSETRMAPDRVKCPTFVYKKLVGPILQRVIDSALKLSPPDRCEKGAHTIGHRSDIDQYVIGSRGIGTPQIIRSDSFRRRQIIVNVKRIALLHCRFGNDDIGTLCIVNRRSLLHYFALPEGSDSIDIHVLHQSDEVIRRMQHIPISPALAFITEHRNEYIECKVPLVGEIVIARTAGGSRTRLERDDTYSREKPDIWAAGFCANNRQAGPCQGPAARLPARRCCRS